MTAHVLYALLWLGFGLGHSLLARDFAKAAMRGVLGAGYRLAYNSFAAGHFAMVWLIGARLLDGRVAFDWPQPVAIGLWLLQIAGLAVFAVGLLHYDLGRFSGLRQIRCARAGIAEPEDENLRLAGLHRYVRHPLYAGVILVVWGRVNGEADLAFAAWATLYILVGLRFEDRSLERRYGDPYRAYRRRVPALLPWRGRALPAGDEVTPPDR